MKYTKSTIGAALALNLSAKNDAEKKLREEIDKANTKIRASKSFDEEALKKRVKEMNAASEWYECLDLMSRTFDTENAEELTDEQVKTALCKARHYTSYVAKQNKETKCFSVDDKAFDYDVTDLLGKLEVSTEYKSEIGLFNLFIALRVDERLGNNNAEEIVRTFKTDDKVKAKIKAGADLSSNRQATLAIQDCINAFLPSCNYHAKNADWEYFVLGVTALNKKELGSIKILPRRTLEKMFYDYICLQIRTGGLAKYKIDYKVSAPKAGEPAPEETPKPEEPKSEETPQIEEPKSEAPATEPAAEPAAAKPAEEPKHEAPAAEPVSAKPEPKSKRGSKKSETAAAKEPKSKRGSKKSEEAAA